MSSDHPHATAVLLAKIKQGPVLKKPHHHPQVGDVVEINERDEDPWWLGRIGDKSGVVHKGYLEPKHA